MKHQLLIIFIIFIFGGCATHPTVSTTPMAQGEKRYGWSWSAENVFPYLWYRYGLSDKDDFGIRVGPAIYGTGFDYSRILYTKDNKWDVMNLAWSLNPNYNTDFTYYKFKQRVNKDDTPGAISWWGLRMMYIAKGITGGSSSRIGFLLGGQPNDRWGYEIGYNHDFSSMPITNIFDFKWNDTVKNDVNLKRRYGDKPHTDPASGLPTEYSRLTGISFRVYVNLEKTPPTAAD
jgi:opacity protein-like surface antigen